MHWFADSVLVYQKAKENQNTTDFYGVRSELFHYNKVQSFLLMFGGLLTVHLDPASSHKVAQSFNVAPKLLLFYLLPPLNSSGILAGNEQLRFQPF